MRIIYNNEEYQILFDPSESEIHINANNIVEARQHFLDRIAWLFDSTVNERFQKTFDEQMEDAKRVVDGTFINKMCMSDEDHEWDCTGISTDGLYYRCRKCNATKIHPVKDCRYTTTTTTTSN
jgi:hypothetical protein